MSTSGTVAQGRILMSGSVGLSRRAAAVIGRGGQEPGQPTHPLLDGAWIPVSRVGPRTDRVATPGPPPWEIVVSGFFVLGSLSVGFGIVVGVWLFIGDPFSRVWPCETLFRSHLRCWLALILFLFCGVSQRQAALRIPHAMNSCGYRFPAPRWLLRNAGSVPRWKGAKVMNRVKQGRHSVSPCAAPSR